MRSTFRLRWLGLSALQDYGLIILNAVLKVTFFSHLVVLGVDGAVWMAEQLTLYACVQGELFSHPYCPIHSQHDQMTKESHFKHSIEDDESIIL